MCSLDENEFFSIFRTPVRAGHGQVNLGLATHEFRPNFAAMVGCEAFSGVENVTQRCAFLEREDGHVTAPVVILVCKHDEHITPLVHVKGRIDIPLKRHPFPHLSCFPRLIDFRHHLVSLTFRVHVGPEGLPVGGDGFATCEVLLVAVVEKGDSLVCELENQRRGELVRPRLPLREETGAVLVADVHGQSIKVFEVWFRFVLPVPDCKHGLALAKHRVDHFVPRVVIETLNKLLVIPDILGVCVGDHAHLEHTSCLGVFGPEILENVVDCLDVDTVEIVVRYYLLDPRVEIGAYGLVFLVEIGMI